MEAQLVRAGYSIEYYRKSQYDWFCLMELANKSKHQIQFLFPRQASTPTSPLTQAFPSVDLVNLTDSICIDLFAQMALAPQETSTVATVGLAADETNE
jgi:hypothetical protein